MNPRTKKQFQRMENRKKKMAAFLQITKLNDHDRAVRCKQPSRPTVIERDPNPPMSKNPHSNGESKKKRIKTHHIDHKAAEVVELEPASSAPSETTSGKEILHGDEFMRLKAELRERKKKLMKQPLFRLRTEGEQACINVKEEERTPLFFSDIQHLLLYSLIGVNSPYSPFSWCLFEKYNRVSHTVVLVLEGLSLYDYLAYESCFPCIAANFATKLEVVTPSAYNGNFAEELAVIPMTHRKEQAMVKRYGSVEAVLRADGNVFRVLRSIFPILESDETRPDPDRNGVEPAGRQPDRLHPSDRFPRTQLIMCPSQLIGENFPVPLKGALKNKYAGYKLTKDLYKEATPLSPMFALDCEMCMTTATMLELTRISIVDESLKCLYDELVLPYNRITNYLTQYSGITPRMMRGVTKRLEDVQEDIRMMLPPDAILIGQSLNGDLQTLKMMHPYVIDTSVIYNVTSDYRRKTKLCKLSLKFLGEEIQTGGAQGHCSTEDSEACMKLVQLKLANSLAFGDTILAGYHPEFRSAQPTYDAGLRFVKFDNDESADAKPSATTQTLKPSSTTQPAEGQNSQLATSLFSHLKNNKKSVGIVGTAQLLEEYTPWVSTAPSKTPSNHGNKPSDSVTTPIHLIPSHDETDVFEQVCIAATKHTFAIGHVRYPEALVTDSPDKEAMFRRIDAACGNVWERLAYNGLCTIVFGGRRGGANGACFIQLKREFK